MSAIWRGCLLLTAVLVAALGLGVGLCGAMLNGGMHGGTGSGLLLIGILMIVGAVTVFVVALRTAREPPPVLELAVYRNGRVAADGLDVDPAQLPGMLAGLHRRNGVVWLYREGASGERHPNAALVARAIAAAHVPLSLSSRPDFSDVLSPDGTTRPR
jgi:hypothetical protein